MQETTGMTVDGPRTLLDKPSALSHWEFLERYGTVYEESPWIADAVWAEHNDKVPLDSVDALHGALKDVVTNAAQEQKIALIQAHPDLAVSQADVQSLSDASRSEQSGAGLDRCSPEEFEEFQNLNVRYKEKFGFPFVLAIKGKSKDEILQAFRARVGNAWEAEFETALTEIHKIAYIRLMQMAG